MFKALTILILQGWSEKKGNDEQIYTKKVKNYVTFLQDFT